MKTEERFVLFTCSSCRKAKTPKEFFSSGTSYTRCNECRDNKKITKKKKEW